MFESLGPKHRSYVTADNKLWRLPALSARAFQVTLSGDIEAFVTVR